MTEIPISSDVINVESCNKDYLEALETLFHLAYNNLMFDLIRVQRLRNLTFDFGSGKKKFSTSLRGNRTPGSRG